MGNPIGEKSSDELLQAQTLLMNHIFNHIDSMSLKCAVELGIANALHRHGRPITLPDLLSALSIPTTKASYLRRLMRLLTHSGFFLLTDSEEEGGAAAYSLTPLSRLLVGDEQHSSLSPYVAAALHPVVMNAFHSMSSWLRGVDDEPTPFSIAHGCGFWEKAHCDPEFSRVFNEGMAGDARFVMDVLLSDCGHVFEGLTSLVDVGGGTGSAARAIAEAFPLIKCSVLDLPHVVDTVPEAEKGQVDFVAGDMFDCVPPANAVLLKWILHDWSDQECVKILRRCKEAIPSKEEGGKIIIIDIVVGSGDYCGSGGWGKTRETQLYWDTMMMVLCPGAEREEEEWRKVFMDAGFSGYKIAPALGVRSVIELYP